MRLLAVILALGLALAGCMPLEQPLRIGAKGFTEQRILAQVLSHLLRQRGGIRTTIVECGDTYACQSALRSGELDLMVEYTGTAFTLSGLSAAEIQPSLARIRDYYRRLDLRWFDPLGFDNAYAVVAPAGRGAALGLNTINDLEQLKGGLRIASPAVYVRRPGDGLFPLLRRYGLRLAEPPLLLDDPTARYAALELGRADAAIAYATDGALQGRRLRHLEDPLGFFPSYEGSVVAREAVLARHPWLTPTLDSLTGRIDTSTMQSLNARVQIDGEEPAAVAASFLRQQGLMPQRAAGPPSRSETRMVHHVDDRLEPEVARAREAAAEIFPQQIVRVAPSAAPTAALTSGRARLAVVGAERFFYGAVGEPVQRASQIEAVAVVGTRTLHLVTRRDAPSDVLRSGRIGLMPPASGTGRVTERLLWLVGGGEPAVYASPEALLARIADGRLDAALIMAPAPASEIASTMRSHPRVTLRGLQDRLTASQAEQVPYLRPTRIAAQTYPDQTQTVETLGSQVVIAAPAGQPGTTTHIAGPAAALRTAGTPLTLEQSEALLEATLSGEMPDPILPSPWSLHGEVRAGSEDRREAIFDTLLNILVLAYLGWLVLQLGRTRRPSSG